MARQARLRLLRRLSGPLLVLISASMGWAAAEPERWSLFVSLGMLAGALVFVRYRVGRVSRSEVLFWAIIARLTLIWLPPSLSDDSYRYVWDGMLQAEGQNPYLYVPSDPALASHRADTIYDRLNSPNYYTVYPPASQSVFALGGLVYPHGWQASYFLIKGVFALAEIAAVWLLITLFRPASVLLYAWNPLVLISAAGQPHGEALALAMLVGVLWAERRSSGAWASILLALATLVKLLPIVFFPFLWRRYGWRGVFPGLLVGLAFCIPYFHLEAILNVLDSLRLYVTLFEFNAGPYYALKGLVSLLTGLDASKVIGPLFGLVFLAVLPRIYRWDSERDGRLRTAMVRVLGLYLVLATTVHPWYLLPLLALSVGSRPAWHWYWLSIVSLGTFLLYVGGPYWPFVAVGWGGWAVLLAYRHRQELLRALMRRRARAKANLVLRLAGQRPFENVLDLGAGEGYVGELIAREVSAAVVLADVRASNRTRLPFVQFGGRALPFSTGRFDLCVLYFVLHHARDARVLLREAIRVTDGRIVIVESVYETDLQRRLLTRMDHLANWIRSGGEMVEPVHLQPMDKWRRLFEELGLEVLHASRGGWWLHPQARFVLASRALSTPFQDRVRLERETYEPAQRDDQPESIRTRQSDETM